MLSHTTDFFINYLTIYPLGAIKETHDRLKRRHHMGLRSTYFTGHFKKMYSIFRTPVQHIHSTFTLFYVL